MKPFVHLHLHTEYSLLDGAARINRLFQKARELNMPAVAMTDHGNMYGAIDFYHASEKEWQDLVKSKIVAEKAQQGISIDRDDVVITDVEKKRFGDLKIKPIIGCEFYVADNHKIDSKEMFHLVLLAKDYQGYLNLVKLNSIAWTEGFYIKPRIDIELIKRYSQGLICMSACLAGRIPRYIQNDEMDKAKEYALMMKGIFGEDFYLELQNHEIGMEKKVASNLIRMSGELGIRLVITNDVHYIDREDYEMQDVLLCIQTGRYIDEENRMRFDGDYYYFKTYDEMLELFPGNSEALDITLEIAEKCNVEIPFKQPLLPPYNPPTGETPGEYLTDLAWEGIKARYGENYSEEIKARTEYELSVIIKMGFAEYYLIVWDFIDYARKHDIPVGAGRGSGVGSIVAYAIGITNVEPLKYNLIFERFLNVERVSNPDFDIDFCVDGREDVIKYVIEKYGKERVTQIITFGTLAAKAAIKDVARVYRMPYAEVDKLTKLLPDVAGKMSIKGILGKDEKHPEQKSPDVIELYNSDASLHKVIDMAMKVEGMPKSRGTHAAGVVICKDVVSDHVPLQKNDQDITTQYPKDQVEELGLLKMDFLGLRTLTDVKKAKMYIYKNYGVKVDFGQLGYNDPNVYQLIGTGETDAVFQLEGEGMKRFMKQLRPTSFEDIIAGISLYRPGPMDSIPKYIECKENPDKIKYADERLRPILEMTYGCMVYQEQVMQIAREIAGYSYGRADDLRRIMSKKKVKAMEEQKKIFLKGSPAVKKLSAVKGAINLGMDERAALKLFDEMANFARYAFNKSHAAAYAVLSYETAYLKRYYRQEFVTAVMNNRITKQEEVAKYVTYLKKNDVPVLKPDVNEGDVYFSTDGKKVRFGLVGIKSVGEEAAKAVIRERERGGKYTGISDFFRRQEIMPNKSMLESMIKAGALDCLGENRATLLNNYEKIVAVTGQDNKKKLAGQYSIFDTMDVTESDIDILRVEELSKKQLLEYEMEVLSVYLSGHPLQDYAEAYREIPFTTGQLVELERDIGDDDDNSSVKLPSRDGEYITAAGMLIEVIKKVDKNGNEMALGKLQDLEGSIDVFVYSNAYAKSKEVLKQGSILRVDGVLKERDGKYSINIRSAKLWQLKETDKVSSREIILVLQLPDDYKAVYSKITDVCKAYKGAVPVYLSISGKYYQFEHCINGSDQVYAELYALLGVDNVHVKDRKK